MSPKAPPTQGRPSGHPAWLPGKSPQILAAVVVNLIAFSFGCAVGWPSVAGPVLQTRGYSEESLSWVAAVVWPAGMVGAALFGPLTERYGRRLAALLVAAPLVAGWAALICDWGLPAVLLGRALLGVGMGGVLIVCPMYVGEIVEDSLRGQLSSYMPLFINAGILYSYAVGALVDLGTLAVLCSVFPVAFLALFAWFPETPTYMLSRGDERGARSSLLWLREPSDVDGELSALRASLKQCGEDSESSQAAASPRELLSSRGSRHALLIVMGLVALQQFSGITAILNYAASIFDRAGSTLDSSTAACVVAAVQLLGSFAACGLADRLGRLPLLVASYGGMAASIGLLGACFYWPATFPGWLPVVCLSVYILVYALGAGPGPFLLLVDVFPSRLRTLASQSALAFLFTLAFLVAKFFSQLADALGPAGCFWLFGVLCAAGVVFILLVIPETKGKAVDEIVAELQCGASSGDERKASLIV